MDLAVIVLYSSMVCGRHRRSTRSPFPSPLLGQNFRVFVFSRSMMLRSAKSEHPRLTHREIIFEDLQPIDTSTS